MKSQQTVYRASGKVLLVGGYGVLQPTNFGLALAVQNHFYSVSRIDSINQEDEDAMMVQVKSKQIDQEWNYVYNQKDCTIKQSQGKINIFVENAVKVGLQYCCQGLKGRIKKISIEVLFDRGFLSQNLDKRNDKNKFLSYGPGTAKTGLGSSACVVVVIVGGLLKLLKPECGPKQVNALSQVANIAAQNKIGSNFDISTAVFGSQLYKNVLPVHAYQAVQSGHIQKVLQIDPEVQKINPHETLVNSSVAWMVDLRRGSNTRTMVSGFIKTLHQQSQQIILEFYQSNRKFVQQIFIIVNSKTSDCSETSNKLKIINKKYRQFLQKYSEITKVPVQPPQFRFFLDQIAQIKGVVYCLCPGSGGYDAIFVWGLLQDQKNSLKIEREIEQICQRHVHQFELMRLQIEWRNDGMSHAEISQVLLYCQY